MLGVGPVFVAVVESPREAVVEVGPQVADFDVEEHRGLPAVLKNAFQRLRGEKPVAAVSIVYPQKIWRHCEN